MKLDIQLNVIGEEIGRLRPEFNIIKDEIRNSAKEPNFLNYVAFDNSKIKLLLSIIEKLMKYYSDYKEIVEKIISKEELESLSVIKKKIEEYKPEYDKQIKEIKDILNQPDSIDLVAYEDATIIIFIDTTFSLFEMYQSYQQLSGDIIFSKKEKIDYSKRKIVTPFDDAFGEEDGSVDNPLIEKLNKKIEPFKVKKPTKQKKESIDESKGDV